MGSKIIIAYFFVSASFIALNQSDVMFRINADSVYNDALRVSSFFKAVNESWNYETEFATVLSLYDTVYFFELYSTSDELKKRSIEKSISKPVIFVDRNWMMSKKIDYNLLGSTQILNMPVTVLILTSSEDGNDFNWNALIDGESMYIKDTRPIRPNEQDALPGKLLTRNNELILNKYSLSKWNYSYQAIFYNRKPFKIDLDIDSKNKYEIGFSYKVEIDDKIQQINVRIIGRGGKLKYFQVFQGGYFGNAERIKLNKRFDRWWRK